MNKTGNKGFKRLINACKYSYQGVRDTFRTEEAFRQEVYAGAVLFLLSFFVADNAFEWAILNIVVLFVMLVELLNSAIEAVVDRIGVERHELSKKAKDAASAAVTVSIIIATIVWIVIIWR